MGGKEFGKATCPQNVGLNRDTIILYTSRQLINDNGYGGKNYERLRSCRWFHGTC